MKLLRLSTQLHKWIALVVGIQVLFWVAGGLVMTAIPIETVRSEHHLAPVTPKPLAFDGVLPVAEAASRAGVKPIEAQLRATPRGPVWAFKPAKGEPVIVSAFTGARHPAMTPDEAQSFARTAYQGKGRPVSVKLLPKAPEETGKTGALWRIDFDDGERTSFYLSPETGEVVSRRSNVWRFYDFFWRLHIMDLEKGENFNHPLIVVATVLTLSIVITGFILLWIKIARDLKSLPAGRRRGA